MNRDDDAVLVLDSPDPELRAGDVISVQELGGVWEINSINGRRYYLRRASTWNTIMFWVNCAKRWIRGQGQYP